MDDLQPNENEDKGVYPNPEVTGTVPLPATGGNWGRGEGNGGDLKPCESNHVLGANGSSFPLQGPCVAQYLQSLH